MLLPRYNSDITQSLNDILLTLVIEARNVPARPNRFESDEQTLTAYQVDLYTLTCFDKFEF